ncbi:hypothetical protein WR43_20270 [Mycolicibacter arupensis]|jgi:hypothetical protein|uniref:Uncharacterized protein n=2 Tax=Mycolicibacter arupensis TaxID=342002 RepID=A0A0F5MR90_9MYCO|nr:hypothetical protein WR43_20270 [Mycolicibacter arupensis]OQZ90825.1 hypothetical protein BST15_20500 [Mycolicibacter arupensis]
MLGVAVQMSPGHEKVRLMQFDLDLLRERVFTKRDKIASDYGIADPADSPTDFAAQVIDAIDQRPAENPLDQHITNNTVFRAAVAAIWSSGTDWKVVLRRRADVEAALHQYDLETLANDPDVTVATLSPKLGSRFQKSHAAAILKWAERLAANPDYYQQAICAVGKQLRSATEPAGLTDGELMIALAVLFSEGATTQTPVSTVPAPELKAPGMGIAISCEFLRNLRWSGFKPDVHITRLFDHWAAIHHLPLAEQRTRAEEIVKLAGRRSREDMIRSVQYALAGLHHTPSDTPASEADNLIWLLGSYIEPIGAETDLPYLR